MSSEWADDPAADAAAKHVLRRMIGPWYVRLWFRFWDNFFLNIVLLPFVPLILIVWVLSLNKSVARFSHYALLRLSPVAPIFYGGWHYSLKQSHGFWFWTETLVVAILIFAFLQFVRISVRQKSVTRQHAQLLWEARTDSRGYFLWLRSFGQFELENLHSVTRPGGVGGYPAPIPVGGILQILEASTKKLGRIIAVGPVRGMDFFFDVESIVITGAKDEWEECVGALIEGARAVFILPETTAGVIKEMSLLRDREALSKTIVIMPPVMSIKDGVVGGSKNSRSRWETVAKELVDKTGGVVRLPDYVDSGMLYIPDDRFSPKQQSQLSTFWKGESEQLIHELVTESLLELLNYVPDHFIPLKDAVATIEKWDGQKSKAEA